MVILKTLFFSLLMIPCIKLFAQNPDPFRYQEEVKEISIKNTHVKPSTDLILFTGSSSIRLWENLAECFPDKNIINTGFGGSHTSDLIYYSNELIIKYKPSQIIIYEGDNDLANNKTPQQVFEDSKTLVRKIQKVLPYVPIIFLSPKPSIARWSLKDSYTDYIRLMEKYTASKSNITFINIWPVMLNKEGKPRNELFVDDNLHLNEKGYEIWAKIIMPYLK